MGLIRVYKRGFKSSTNGAVKLEAVGKFHPAGRKQEWKEIDGNGRGGG